MSKKQNINNTLSYIPKNILPKLGKYPNSWDMKGLYYKSITDPQIEKDVQATERAYLNFAKRYRTSDFATNPKTLFKAVSELNKLDENPIYGKAGRYLGLLTALDSGDEAASKKLNLLSQRLTKAGNEMLFFGIELAKVPKQKQNELLKHPLLTDFKYDLKQLFENAKHQLTESEEKLLRQLGDCSYGMWVEMTEKMLGKRSITFKGEEIPVNSAFDRVGSLPFKDQPAFWKILMQEIAPLAEVVEHELTAVCTRKKLGDELRSYPKVYSAAVIGHEDNEKSVETLIAAVSTSGFELSKKFYKLKAKLHGQKKIDYSQRSASIGNAPVVDFSQATEICRDVFYGVNPTYGEIFDRILTNGQIDVYPKKGKRGGAFMTGETGQPTQVFLNQVDTIRALQTYAHEMGHAIHTERSKTQPAHYQDYSTTTAETASTFFEGLVFDAVLEQATPDKRALLLHDKIGGDVATIQRQIAFHNFELEMHTHVREQGAISHTELNQLMQKHMRAYCGPAVNISELDGHSYIYVSHFRYGFYVYTYTFGILMSSLMAENLKSDPSYSTQIDKFLTAGGSDTVANIFKSIGINTNKIETFEGGLDKMQAEITLLQKLTR